MFVITHALSPVIAVAAADAVVLEATGNRLFRRTQYVAIAISGALPDILNPHITLAARFASWSHTVLALVVFIPVAIFIARRINREQFILSGILMAAAYAFHLFCDAISGGIAWIYPFDPKAIVGSALVPFKYWLILDAVCFTLVGTLTLWLRRREMAIIQKTAFSE
jgi:hypothetical protein